MLPVSICLLPNRNENEKVATGTDDDDLPLIGIAATEGNRSATAIDVEP